MKLRWFGEGHFLKNLACTEEKEDPRVRSGTSQNRFYFEVRKKWDLIRKE